MGLEVGWIPHHGPCRGIPLCFSRPGSVDQTCDVSSHFLWLDFLRPQQAGPTDRSNRAFLMEWPKGSYRSPPARGANKTGGKGQRARGAQMPTVGDVKLNRFLRSSEWFSGHPRTAGPRTLFGKRNWRSVPTTFLSPVAFFGVWPCFPTPCLLLVAKCFAWDAYLFLGVFLTRFTA